MATKIKTYWDKIKKDELCFSAGRRGWQVKYFPSEYHVWDFGKSQGKSRIKMELQFSFWDDTPRSERAEVRKEATQYLKARKIAAQMSRDQEEFQDIFHRVDQEKLLKITEGKTIDISLGDYIRQHYLTDAQAYTLFWRM